MTLHRRHAVIGVVLAVLVALLVSGVREGATGTESGTAFPDGIVVVGDSITARYDDDPGSEQQGWWSIVGRHFGAEVRTHAQSGSGYLRPGLRCGGNRFGDRMAAFEGPAPSLFLVEGGRNDWATCREGRFVRSSDAAVQAAVERYFALLDARLPASTRIVVLGPPWGPRDPWEMRRITSIVRTAALRHDLEYVSTRGTLEPRGRTVDGVHPNLAGSTALGTAVIAALGAPAS